MQRIILAEIIFSLAVWAMQEVPRGKGSLTLVAILLIFAALPLLCAAAARRRPPPARSSERLMVGAIALFAVAQLVFAVIRMVKTKVIDIADTTLAAILALAHGQNPYALPLDQLAGGIIEAGAQFHGYKYLPVMIAAYAPLGLALGIRGIVLTNLLLQGAAAAVIGWVAARGGGRGAGLAAAVLYLSLPFLAHQLLTRGVNDLVAVLPLLLALLLVEERPGWAGFLVGLSLAAKLMPGAALALCLVPGRGRPRYFAGVVVGLLPILPFAVAAPDAFAANILLFNALRPIDDTSWLFGPPHWVVVLSRGVAAAALLGVWLRVWTRPPGLDARCAWAIAAILLVFAAGPDMHHNYYLWFIPFLAILAGRAAIGTPVERAAESG
jgi:hypothetical protein